MKVTEHCPRDCRHAVPWRGTTLLAILILAGCTKYQVASPVTITPGSTVRLSFPTPQSLLFRTARGDSLPVRGIVQLDGRMVGRSGDTITVEVRQIKYPDPFIPRDIDSGTTTRLVLRDIDRMEEHTADGTSSVLALLGAVAVILVVTGALGWEGSEPEPPPPPEEKAPKEI